MARFALLLVCLMALIIPSLSWNRDMDSSSRSKSGRGNRRGNNGSSSSSEGGRGRNTKLSAALKKKEVYGFYTKNKALFVFKKVGTNQAGAADVCKMYGLQPAHFKNGEEMNEVCVKFLINQLKVNNNDIWTGYKYSKGGFTFDFDGKRRLMGYKIPKGSYDKCSCTCSTKKDSGKYFYYSPCFSKMSDSVAEKIVAKGNAKKTCLTVKNDKLYAHDCAHKFFVLCRKGCY